MIYQEPDESAPGYHTFQIYDEPEENGTPSDPTVLASVTRAELVQAIADIDNHTNKVQADEIDEDPAPAEYPAILDRNKLYVGLGCDSLRAYHGRLVPPANNLPPLRHGLAASDVVWLRQTRGGAGFNGEVYCVLRATLRESLA
jgi:hypothetical protein